MPRRFQQDLDALRDRLLFMGEMVQKAIRTSILTIAEYEASASQEVFALEEQINQLHIEIDERAVKLLALQQPVAVDLRFITAAIKINTDLERMADHTVNIITNASYLDPPSGAQPMPDLMRMAEMTERMVRESLNAFVSKDVALARSILPQDDAVDRLKDKIFHDRIADMKTRPQVIEQEFDEILIARNLERIADHATNIAEDVIFMVLGKDIRHHAGEEEAGR